MQLRVVHVIDKSIHNQLPQESGPACHAGQFGFFVEDEFFIVAQIEDDLVFPGTFFVSVFVHFMIPFFLVLDGFMGKYGLAFPFGVRRFCSVFSGVRGSPMCSKMCISLQVERGVFEGCV